MALSSLRNRGVLAGLVATAAIVAATAASHAADQPAKTPEAWTYDDAVAQLRLNPEDVYLQYVVMQLGRNEGKASAAADAIRGARGWRPWQTEREVDLFALFTGALAVQEALQLDTMRGQEEPGRERPAAAADEVPVAELKGPAVKSHPWGKMLAAQTIGGRQPQLSPLAMCVPEDQYYVVFRSLSKLLEVADAGELWGSHLMKQATKSAQSHLTGERLKRQLAIRTDRLTRPFYDMVVDEAALTGSDLYFREGSDVTVLFRLKQPEVFRLRMDMFLVEAEKSRPDAVRSTGRIGGVEYVEVSTPDRAIHAFSAYPRPDLHVRSNSKAALARVLAAIAGDKDVKRLGDSTELKYIRTLMVRGDQREDGFLYLSDPFIRRLVGPEVKLTERRRMVCYNHLRMIGHASMLYRTQYGKAPESLAALATAGCAPGEFGRGALRCPDGGTYTLSADGTTGVCSRHGHPQQLVPCCEVAVERISKAEADEYRQFVERYSQYWRRYFDPIAVRVQVAPKQYRAETIILPLLDNSIYTGMAAALGGEPEPLDALPVPDRNIFTVAVRVNKETMLAKAGPGGLFGELERDLGGGPGPADIEQLLVKGLGNQVSLNVYDASPMFDFNLTEFLGQAIQEFGGWGRFDSQMLPISFLVASLNTPVYAAAPVRDAAVVDRFLDQLDGTLSRLARRPPELGWFEFDMDFYKLPLAGIEQPVRCFCLEFGPVKWRMFYARIGDGLYVASKPFILEDLAKIAGQKPQQPGSPAHAMVRLRPEHWKEILTTFRLGWAESGRQACLNNLGPLSSIARALRASGEAELTGRKVVRYADQVHAVHFFCPEGGQYQLSPDGRQVICSLHGSAAEPKQLAAPAAGSPLEQALGEFAGATAQLVFLEDGLHAVVVIERK